MVSRGGEDCVRDATHKRIDTPRVKRMRHVDASKGTGYTVLSNFFSSFFPSLLSSIHSDRTDAGAYPLISRSSSRAEKLIKRGQEKPIRTKKDR